MKTCDLKTDIVILGAGVGGYEAFRTLARHLKLHRLKKTITLIDRNNYFTFTPMLHEVASGSILPTHAAVAIRELIYKTPHQFLKATVKKIDPKKKLVETSCGKVYYDYCIVALGSETNFFNTPGAGTYTHDVRTLSAALQLQKDFARKLDELDQDNEFYITVVGGGFTGVEVAGQFSDLVNEEIKKLYPGKTIHIQIVHAGDTLVPQVSPAIQKKAEAKLKKEKVMIYFDCRAKEVTKNSVILDNGNTLVSDLTIWTAGFKNIGPHYLDEEFCEKDRIPVNQFLQHQKFHSLYAVGDNALFYNVNEDQPAPQLGEVAHRAGRYAARHIVSVLLNKPLHKPFHFKSHGILMPIGDWYGIAQVGPIVFSGWFAWWIRRTVYLLYMPGFIRKIRIVFDWTMHSFSFRNIINIDRK